jgi:hypothetical protein
VRSTSHAGGDHCGRHSSHGHLRPEDIADCRHARHVGGCPTYAMHTLHALATPVVRVLATRGLSRAPPHPLTDPTLCAVCSSWQASVFILAAVLITNPHEVPLWRGWLSAISLFLFMGFFEIGLGPTVWLILSEMYPLSGA